MHVLTLDRKLESHVFDGKCSNLWPFSLGIKVCFHGGAKVHWTEQVTERVNDEDRTVTKNFDSGETYFDSQQFVMVSLSSFGDSRGRAFKYWSKELGFISCRKPNVSPFSWSSLKYFARLLGKVPRKNITIRMASYDSLRGGLALHRGSIRASLLAAPGSNPASAEIFSTA